MTALRVYLARLGGMLRGRRRDDQLVNEIEHHLALATEEYRRKGLADAEARLAARRDFGGVLQVRESYRAQRRLPSLDSLLLDVRFAIRGLARDRASTVAAIGILALGVGATAVMADMLDRLLIRRPAQVTDPERVVRLYSRSAKGGRPGALITNYPTAERLAEGLRDEVPFVAAYIDERLGLGRGPDAQRVDAVSYTGPYFDVLGLMPQLGALPTEAEAEESDLAVISDGFWKRRFGGAHDVLGRTLHLGKRLYTVAAVLPRGFKGIDHDAVDVWLPLGSRAADGALMTEGWRTGTGYYRLRAIARLAPGVERHVAEARASAIFNADPPPTAGDPTPTYQIVFGALPPSRQPGGADEATIMQWLGAIAALVLLIACGNVGNLLLVRGFRRSGELALKTAFGATRGRLAREVLIEASLLAIAAAVVAVFFVSTAGAAVRRAVLPPVLDSANPLDGRVLAVTAGLCLATAFLLGIVPAIRLTSARLLAPARRLHSRPPSRVLDGFVGLQVALSLPLIVGASLFSVSFWQARQANFGLNATDVVVISMSPEELGTPEATHAAHRRIQQRLGQLPQVHAAALVQTLPFVNVYATVVLPSPTPPAGPYGEAPGVNGVDPEFFQVVGMRFVAGRPFTAGENVAGGRRLAIVNETLARRLWPKPAVGRCLYLGFAEDPPCIEVVGVVADAATWPALWHPRPTPGACFLPIEQHADLTWMGGVLVRTTDPAHDVMALLRSEAQQTGAMLPYIDVWALDDLFQPALRPLRLGAKVFVAFGLLALLIASAGLAGVTAYGVTRRRRELAIRMALGAEPAGLILLTLRGSVTAATAGLAAGCVLAYVSSRWLTSVLYGISPGDVRVYAGAAGALLVVSLVAAYLPARGAGRVDPAVALRAE